MSTIVDSVVQQLADSDPLALDQILARIPQLAHDQEGAEVLRLLLRLDPRMSQTPDGRWTVAPGPRTAEQRIVTAVQSYLESLPSGGAMLTAAVQHVVGSMQYDSDYVTSVIQRNFHTKGKVVFNRLRER